MNRPLDLQKKELRKILKEKRNALDPDTCRSSDTAIFKAITSWDVYQKAETVFCFVGTEDEINTRPVLEDLLKEENRWVYRNVSAKALWKYIRSVLLMT